MWYDWFVQRVLREHKSGVPDPDLEKRGVKKGFL